MCMGWDGPYFVDEMVQIRVIPSFVCFERLRDGMKYVYLIIFSSS
jgi:hypothetical protein